MKPSILIVMLDFLVCSLLLFVIGTGGKQTQFATSAPGVHEEFSSAAMQAQQEEWNRDYEQQTLLTQLNAATAENEQLRNVTAQREQTIQELAEEKARVEQSKTQIEQSLTSVATQLSRVSAERERLEKEGEAAKESLGKLQTEFTGLQTQQTRLQQEKAQLEQHAERLGQTVASQQATISTLSDEVRASQARVEAQLGGVREDQQAMQQNVAALTEDVKDLQGLSAEENALLLQAVADMAKGQQELQSRLDDLLKAGQGDQVTQGLSAIQSGQDALRLQTAKLGEQIESIKARGPGPFKAVKGARLELLVAIAKRDSSSAPISRFKSAAYPPVVNIGGHSFVIANYQTLGFNWWPLRADYYPSGEITEVKYTVDRTGDTSWSAALSAPACVLHADPRVVAIELDHPAPGLTTMELAGPDTVLQTDQRKLHIFKSTAAGLSFEADTSPDLSDARYLIVKRTLRGVAAWFENPANRAEVGDYVVTSDGKLVGIMVSREQCFILSKDGLQNCALTVPLADKQQFQRTVRQFPRVK